MVDLTALTAAHDFCTNLLDVGDANGYAEAIQMSRKAAPGHPYGRYRNVPIALLKSTLVASDGHVQHTGARL